MHGPIRGGSGKTLNLPMCRLNVVSKAIITESHARLAQVIQALGTANAHLQTTLLPVGLRRFCRPQSEISLTALYVASPGTAAVKLDQ